MKEKLLEIIDYGRTVETSIRYYYNNRVRLAQPTIYVIQRTIRGQLFYRDSSGERRILPGQAVCFYHGEDSEYGYPADQAEPYELEYIAFRGPAAKEIFDILRHRKGCCFPMPQGSLIYLHFREIIKRFDRREIRSRFEASALLYSFLMNLLETPEPHNDSVLSRAHDYILNHFREPITLKEVADAVNCSREHLTRIYREHYGIPPGHQLQQLRMSSARELLTHSNAPIATIARRCGYLDPESFSRAFRRIHKQSPAEFSQTAKQSGKRP